MYRVLDAGEGAANVISDTVRLSGTLRAVTSSTVQRLRQRVEVVANATARAHGCHVRFNWEARPYPATVNDANLAELVRCRPASAAGRAKMIHFIVLVYVLECICLRVKSLGMGCTVPCKTPHAHTPRHASPDLQTKDNSIRPIEIVFPRSEEAPNWIVRNAMTDKFCELYREQ